jgi:hypothetical protein
MLQLDTRRAIEKFFRPGKNDSARLTRALVVAAGEILWHEMNGHRMPRDGTLDL